MNHNVHHNYKNTWEGNCPAVVAGRVCKPRAASGAHKLVEVVLAGLGPGLHGALRVPTETLLLYRMLFGIGVNKSRSKE